MGKNLGTEQHSSSTNMTKVDGAAAAANEFRASDRYYAVSPQDCASVFSKWNLHSTS